MKKLNILVLVIISVHMTVVAQAAVPAGKKAIVGANVVDLNGKAPLQNAVVIIEGGRISAIGARAETAIPADAEIIDATDSWLIPGLMNMHVHLGLKLPGKMANELAHETEGELTLRMAAAAREISFGATWIKIAISGGIATDGGGIAEALMTPEEISAVIDVAHRFGAKVTAHSGSSAATTVAVDAGIDGIEHGYILDRTVLKKMKANGTWLVPTIVVSRPATQPFFEKIESPEWYLKRRDSVGKDHWKALEMAIEEGVIIALGTDQLPSEPNDGTTATAREAQYYVEAGMSPLQALRSATIESARMLGAEKDIGSLEVGKYADIVAVDSDPTKDIKALRNMLLVLKDGKVYRNERL